MSAPLQRSLPVAIAAVLLASTLNAQPTIDWSTARAPSLLHTRDTNFLGLLRPVIRVYQLYPTLASVFFERGSVRFPERYVSFEGGEPRGFNDTAIPGGTMEKYRTMLNIIGYRLNRYPTAKLTITGCSSNEPRFGETLDLARRRAEAVRDYLVRVGGIDASRLVVKSRLLPPHPARSDDTLGRAENQRVELASTDPRIVDVIFDKNERWFYEPDSVVLRASNGDIDSQVVSRSIEITRSGRHWHTFPLAPTGDTAVVYNWGFDGNRDSMPTDTLPYLAEVKLRLRDGRTLSARSLIPLRVLMANDRPTEHPWEDNIDEYNLLLFAYDEATASAFQRRVFDEYIRPWLGRARKIRCTGHTDIIGDEDHNLDLSECRGRTMAALIRQGGTAPRGVKPEVIGTGENNPLYSNDLPEGRMLNRTVNVRVLSPRENKR